MNTASPTRRRFLHDLGISSALFAVPGAFAAALPQTPTFDLVMGFTPTVS